MDADLAVRPAKLAATRGEQVSTSISARWQLRQATADIHDAVHRHPGFVSLMRGSLTTIQYSALLARLYGFHCAFEHMLRATQPGVVGGIDPGSCGRAHLLRADLLALGLGETEIDSLPLCAGLPEIRSPETLLGCLYVVEGSALGGSVIARKLDYLLGGESPEGRSFFLGRQSPDPMPWPEFCRLLEISAEKGDIAEIIRGARSMFEAIELWLGETSVNG
jgi:heme oxygenase (biliverdin-IX-beta and delta-forming)